MTRDPKRPGPGPLAIGALVGLYVTLLLLFMPVFPCPQPCCDRDRKFQRLMSLAGVSPAEAKRMIDWADRYPCARSGMRRGVNVVGWVRSPER